MSTVDDRPTVAALACREMLREFRRVRRRLARLGDPVDPAGKRVSHYLGVTRPDGPGRSWMAQVHHAGQLHYVGSFATEEEAARAYDREATRLKGDRARLNFPAVPFPAAEGGAP